MKKKNDKKKLKKKIIKKIYETNRPKQIFCLCHCTERKRLLSHFLSYHHFSSASSPLTLLIDYLMYITALNETFSNILFCSLNFALNFISKLDSYLLWFCCTFFPVGSFKCSCISIKDWRRKLKNKTIR